LPTTTAAGGCCSPGNKPCGKACPGWGPRLSDRRQLGLINRAAGKTAREQADYPAALTPAFGRGPAPDAVDPVLCRTTQSFIPHELEPRATRVPHHRAVRERLRAVATVLPAGNSRRRRTRNSWGGKKRVEEVTPGKFFSTMRGEENGGPLADGLALHRWEQGLRREHWWP